MIVHQNNRRLAGLIIIGFGNHCALTPTCTASFNSISESNISCAGNGKGEYGLPLLYRACQVALGGNGESKRLPISPKTVVRLRQHETSSGFVRQNRSFGSACGSSKSVRGFMTLLALKEYQYLR